MLRIRDLLFSEIVELWYCAVNRLLVLAEIDGSVYLHKAGVVDWSELMYI